MQVREASFPQAPGRRRLRATSTAPSSFILPWGHGDSEGQPRCHPALPPSTPQFSSQPKPVPGRASPPLPVISSSSSTTLIPFIPGTSWVSFAGKPLRAQEPFPQGRCLVPLHVAPGTRPRGDTAAMPGTARSKPGSKQPHVVFFPQKTQKTGIRSGRGLSKAISKDSQPARTAGHVPSPRQGPLRGAAPRPSHPSGASPARGQLRPPALKSHKASRRTRGHEVGSPTPSCRAQRQPSPPHLPPDPVATGHHGPCRATYQGPGDG